MRNQGSGLVSRPAFLGSPEEDRHGHANDLMALHHQEALGHESKRARHGPNHRCVIARRVRARVSDDHTGVVNTHGELLPPARATASMVRSGPVSLAGNRQASAVDEEMKACAPWTTTVTGVTFSSTPVGTGGRRGDASEHA